MADDKENQSKSNAAGLTDWQNDLIDERLNDYCQNLSEVLDFGKTLDEMEKGLRATLL